MWRQCSKLVIEDNRHLGEKAAYLANDNMKWRDEVAMTGSVCIWRSGGNTMLARIYHRKEEERGECLIK